MLKFFSNIWSGDSDEEDEKRLLPDPSSWPCGPRELFAHVCDEDGDCKSARVLDLLGSRKYGRLNLSHPDYCIIPLDDPHRQVCQDKLFGRVPFDCLAEDRALGSLLGMPLGDSIGAPLEFEAVRYNIQTVDGWGTKKFNGAFCLRPGQYTDDSSMGLCLADSLLANGAQFLPVDLMLRFLSWWHFGYNNGLQGRNSVGLGGNISSSFHTFMQNGLAYTNAGDKKTCGNGSIMRNGAVAVAYHDNPEMGSRVARLQSLVTHQGDEAAECCRLMVHIVTRALRGPASAQENKRHAMENLEDFVSTEPSVVCLARSQCEGDNPDRDWNWKNPNFRYSPTRARQQPGYIGSYAMDGLAMALHCVWTTDSFRAAVNKAANVCGDADSVASVAGQLAGAIYGASGIPRDWIQTLQQWDRGGDIALRGYRLYHKLYDLSPMAMATGAPVMVCDATFFPRADPTPTDHNNNQGHNHNCGDSMPPSLESDLQLDPAVATVAVWDPQAGAAASVMEVVAGAGGGDGGAVEGLGEVLVEVVEGLLS